MVWPIAGEGVELVARKVLAAGNNSGIDVQRTVEVALTLDLSNLVAEGVETLVGVAAGKPEVEVEVEVEVEAEAEAPVDKAALVGKGGTLDILVVDSREVVESMGCALAAEVVAHHILLEAVGRVLTGDLLCASSAADTLRCIAGNLSTVS